MTFANSIKANLENNNVRVRTSSLVSPQQLGVHRAQAFISAYDVLIDSQTSRSKPRLMVNLWLRYDDEDGLMDDLKRIVDGLFRVAQIDSVSRVEIDAKRTAQFDIMIRQKAVIGI